MVRRPLISSDRETSCTTQPPIVGHPYLRKFRRPHPEEVARPAHPQPHFPLPLGCWRAWQAWDQKDFDPPSPHPWEVWILPGGTIEGGAGQGLGLSWVSEVGS